MSVFALNILLADDDTDDCIFFEQALKEYVRPTKLQMVHDGEHLMHLLRYDTVELPHILFLDLNMPRKNGFECLSEIKLDNRLNPLPVIIFSTSYDQDVVDLLYKKGAQYFIRKPPEFLRFKKIVQQTLSLLGADNNLSPTKEDFVLTV